MLRGNNLSSGISLTAVPFGHLGHFRRLGLLANMYAPGVCLAHKIIQIHSFAYKSFTFNRTFKVDGAGKILVVNDLKERMQAVKEEVRIARKGK